MRDDHGANDAAGGASAHGDAALHRQALQEHGHTFQYAVIKAIQRANEQRGMGWQFIGAEVPLVLNGEEVHADFILQQGCRYARGSRPDAGRRQPQLKSCSIRIVRAGLTFDR